MITRTNNYKIDSDIGGFAITNIATDESVYIQGEEADDFQEKFASAASDSEIDVVCSEYDDVMA